MLVKIFASAIFGVSAQTIIVEVNIDQGVGYHLVGLPDSAIKESNFRINAALKNSNLKLPGKKITINMAPADLQKEGSAYDLPIAIGILAASEQIKSEQVGQYVMMGELSLDGSLRPIKGALPIAIKAKEEGFDGIAKLFEEVGKIEKEHEERYLKLLENVKEGKVFEAGEVKIWKCRNCGHIVIGKKAPEICPVCSHPKAYFEIKAENY